MSTTLSWHGPTTLALEICAGVLYYAGLMLGVTGMCLTKCGGGIKRMGEYSVVWSEGVKQKLGYGKE